MEIDFAAVFEESPTASMVLSPDLVIRAVNRAYEKATGLERAVLIGLPLVQIPAGPSGHGPADAQRSLERVLAEGETDIVALLRYDLEIAGRPGEFRERHWNVVNAPMLDSDGNVVAIIHKVHEITPFIDQLRRAVGAAAAPDSAAAQMQQIEVELLDRSRELQEVNERLHRARALERKTSQELRRQMRRHRDAVADTSHDLKGPISGLQTRLQAALADTDTDLRSMLLAALQDAERLDAIVSELLVLAQLESGAPTDVQTVDLARLIETELARRPPGITITSHLQPDTKVEGSPVQLARLLENLIGNAERHASTGVEVSVTTDDGWALLQVADDGPGIPAADRRAVFGRFYRRADARRKDPNGTGLGLPIARQIAHSHHGSLHIDDNHPGTRLVLRIPSAPTAEE